MSKIITVGPDLAKNVFQLHGADASGHAVLRKRMIMSRNDDRPRLPGMQTQGMSASPAQLPLAKWASLRGA